MKGKKKNIFVCALIWALCCAFPFGCAASGYTVYSPTSAFSDSVLFSARMLGAHTDKAYGRMTEVIAEIDAEVSLTRADSDLVRFNSAGRDEQVRVGKHTYALFSLAKRYYELTDGAFNPALSPLGALWRVDASSLAEMSIDGNGERVCDEFPSFDSVSETLSYCTPDKVTATEENGNYYLVKSDARVKLDFGGIAKGYAVNKCAEILKSYDIPSALLDISGNSYFYGRYVEGGEKKDWNIGVVAPRPRARTHDYVCAVSSAGDESAVTSGDYMRYYACDGVYVQHIIGRDGVPVGVVREGEEWKNAEEWVISATVFGEDSALCDALSTAVCVLGLEDGSKLLQKVGYKGLIFTEKRFTIIGNVTLYKPDVYDGFKAYAYEH